jgi:hypothetical protein
VLQVPQPRLTLRQADAAQQDIAQLMEELDFVKAQQARLPRRKDLAFTPLRVMLGSAVLSAHAIPIALSLLTAFIYMPNREWTPLPKGLPELGSPGGRPIELVSGGCGWGWHRNYWKDRWGNPPRVAA